MADLWTAQNGRNLTPGLLATVRMQAETYFHELVAKRVLERFTCHMEPNGRLHWCTWMFGVEGVADSLKYDEVMQGTLANGLQPQRELQPSIPWQFWACEQSTGRDHLLAFGTESDMRKEFAGAVAQGRDVWLIHPDGTKELPDGRRFTLEQRIADGETIKGARPRDTGLFAGVGAVELSPGEQQALDHILPEEPDPAVRLQEEERDILLSLADAWNKWVKLEARHPDADAEMRHAIHAAQMLVAGRVARRVDPDVWWQPAERSNDNQQP